MPRLSLAVATAFGVGYVPFAPGTFGSLAGLVVFAGRACASGMPVGRTGGHRRRVLRRRVGGDRRRDGTSGTSIPARS